MARAKLLTLVISVAALLGTAAPASADKASLYISACGVKEAHGFVSGTTRPWMIVTATNRACVVSAQIQYIRAGTSATWYSVTSPGWAFPTTGVTAPYGARLTYGSPLWCIQMSIPALDKGWLVDRCIPYGRQL
jgi:hypothetical protein